MKGWATALCMNDEASFDHIIKTTIPPFAHLMKPVFATGYPSRDTPLGQTREAEAICSQLGLAPGSLKD